MAKTIGRFQIGDWVEVKTKVEFAYNDNKREMVKVSFSRPAIGQVCGSAEKQTGRYNSGTPRNSYDDDYDPPYFEVDKVIPVWEVRLGMKNRPILALNEDVDLAQEHIDRLPWFYATQYPLPPGYQEMMRNEMKDWPRDEGGRWIRKTK